MKAIKRKAIRRWPQRPVVGKWPSAQSRKELALLGLAGRAEATAGLPEALPDPCWPEASREAGPDPHGILGQPMGLRQTAKLIGCSPWTVRQVLIPEGLPVFRATASGKLIFYRNQVLRWVLRKQQGGL
jgi:hypothetical protein